MVNVNVDVMSGFEVTIALSHADWDLIKLASQAFVGIGAEMLKVDMMVALAF